MSSNNKGLRKALMGAILALAAIAAPAQALDFTNVAYIQAGTAPTSIPVGHMEFCKTRPQECAPHKQVVDAISLDERLWGELLNINAYVNQTVTPVTDQDLYQTEEFWTYPNGYGDCEDYVLEKRRHLINAGWPASALLISVVKQLNGEGHAVLVVRTDRGDLVLDNQVGSVELWSDTPYVYVKRQSQANAGQWVDMVETRDTVTITAAIK
ncbi:MAG: transglutaminase-like cysteine peptidase [Candidatus Devosia phytovorans]|uniref:Transglutaminase-like cysteine peptidase n=1 Tax=Candidatus Devosia phytovorans TaxID=3121372 RepID=A0AAJ5VXD2_9HYPH|nr:transglutaminase-like cysteine peptidase [Devosia sp.]WEK05655.1 MAG: transglutaminase-like cysteine peptidase [Devosia sp.]